LNEFDNSRKHSSSQQAASKPLIDQRGNIMSKCETCAYFIKPDDTQEVAGRFLEEAVCGMTGAILSHPTDETRNKDVREYHASICNSYSDQATAVPVTVRSSVGPVLVPQEDPTDTPIGSVRSCMGCSNLVRSDAMLPRFGFNHGTCSVTGRMVMVATTEASACSYGVQGPPLTMVPPGTVLQEQYRPNFSWRDLTHLAALVVDGFADPRDYETDKEVTPEDDAHGIRAWREVKDPEGQGETVYLPIFKGDHLDEAERLLVPQIGDEEHPELYVDYEGLLYQFAVDSWTLDETFCLIGAPGLGKTEFGRWAAHMMQVPFRRFSFSKSSDVDDMAGKTKLDPERGTYYELGRVPLAYTKVGLIIMDELNVAPDECKQFLRPIMDNSKQLVLDQDSGQRLLRHPFARVMVAINPSWDYRNLGAEEMADAEVNRMSFAYVDYPPAQIEAKIIKLHCATIGYDIPDALVDKLIRIGSDIREASRTGTFPGTWGIRQQVKVAKKTKYYGLVRAYKQASFNYYDQEAMTEVISLIG
jgi:MoxR-like ATPase